MSLTGIRGPFGMIPNGAFNFDAKADAGYFIYLEDTPRRIRTVLNGQTIADSSRAKMLHLSRSLPAYYFPRDDVRTELLVPSERRDHDPHRGEVQFWSVQVGNRFANDAAWEHVDPPASASFLRDYISFDFAAMDAWYEEDDEIKTHPPDPYHRIDVRNSKRDIRVSYEGALLGETSRARVLFETGLPPRYYMPREDVKVELVPSETHTNCAYKGQASYWSVKIGDEVIPDLVWYYPDPEHEADAIRGYVCFYNERVDIDVDGVRQARPETPWSRQSNPPMPMVGAKSGSL